MRTPPRDRDLVPPPEQELAELHLAMPDLNVAVGAGVPARIPGADLNVAVGAGIPAGIPGPDLNVAVGAGIPRPLFNQANRLNDDFSWKFFIYFVTQSFLNLSPKQYGSLLSVFGGLLIYLTKTCASQFESFDIEKTTITPVEAFYDFFPAVVHITVYIICWIITFALILLLLLVLQIPFGLLWLCSTLIYCVELIQKTSASGVHVASGEAFKLPVLLFVAMQAVGFSLIFGLLLFILAYLSWRCFHRGEPRNAIVNLGRLIFGAGAGV